MSNISTEALNFVKECNIPDYDNFLAKIEIFKTLLIEENKVHNLTRITEDADFWNKHVCDSLSFGSIFPELTTQSLNIIDIGCGAGFPSFVLALAYPNLQITAVDSVGKKINFLNKAIKEISLKNITALHMRSKEMKEFGKFDIITARAVAEAPKLFKESKRLLKENGQYILYKTPSEVNATLDKTISVSKNNGFSWNTSKEFTLPSNEKRIFLIGKHNGQ